MNPACPSGSGAKRKVRCNRQLSGGSQQQDGAEFECKVELLRELKQRGSWSCHRRALRRMGLSISKGSPSIYCAVDAEPDYKAEGHR